MCIDIVSLPNVSRYDNISIYCYISNIYTDSAVVLYTCSLASDALIINEASEIG